MKNNNKENKENYENSIKELKKIIDDLDSKKINLNEALEKFKRGNEIIKYCENELVKADKQIETIINDNKKNKE